MHGDWERYRNRLLALRAELAAVAGEGEAASATVELDQSRVGRLSRMDALQGQAMAQATASRRQLQLTRIEAALVRLTRGEYGCCLRCGEEIGGARLAADPAAVACIGCAEQAERRG